MEIKVHCKLCKLCKPGTLSPVLPRGPLLTNQSFSEGSRKRQAFPRVTLSCSCPVTKSLDEPKELLPFMIQLCGLHTHNMLIPYHLRSLRSTSCRSFTMAVCELFQTHIAMGPGT